MRAERGCGPASAALVSGMHVSFALFADAANISQEGKLNILGVFEALQVAQLPTVHPGATMVVRLKALPDDAVVIVEGNYLLLDEPPWSELVDLFDAIAYLDVPDDVRVGRLVDRHVEFGRTRPEALDFAHRSDEANARRIAPSKVRADVLVSFARSPISRP